MIEFPSLLSKTHIIEKHVARGIFLTHTEFGVEETARVRWLADRDIRAVVVGP
jgi:hypothetical protein